MESEDGEPIKIVLVDTSSNQRITSGPMSSMKIEIVVLNGDFTATNGEDWTKKEFDASVIRAREGKRPLVTGDLTLTLRNGVADLGNICFTDNSSWIRSRKFRLGARVHGNSTQARIKEAKSEPFIVKDHRGECKSSQATGIFVFTFELCLYIVVARLYFCYNICYLVMNLFFFPLICLCSTLWS